MDYILTEIINKVCVIRLNRPEKFNSFVRPMALKLQEVLADCEADSAIRCIVIVGVGKAFCAGQDLQEATDPQGPQLTTIVSEHYNPIIKLIRNVPKPVITAVNGVAAGAGANIALAGDIVIASESASFIQAFSKIGLIPDSGGTYTLPRLIGLQRASALMMLGDKISAKDAQSMGMIYQYFPDDVFWESVMVLAHQMSEMPTLGLALTKQALNATFDNTLDQQLQLEDLLQTKAGMSHDYREGTSAFLEKRKPSFKGH
ncbi:MAG: enoyl-CoA hydratase-related protein [Saprospiraceae bacterium]